MSLSLHNVYSSTWASFTISEGREGAARVPLTAADARRFLGKRAEVSPESCWLWTASRLGLFYGQFVVQGRDGRQHHLYAHRVAWALANGPIPAGQSVLHRCDVPLCVNPRHLFLGTQTDNMRDAASKGRLNGPRPRARRLTDEDVACIRELGTSGLTVTDLAQRYCVTKSFISLLLSGKRRVYAAPQLTADAVRRTP